MIKRVLLGIVLACLVLLLGDTLLQLIPRADVLLLARDAGLSPVAP